MSMAVWRMSNLLVHEIGPWNVFTRLRERFEIVHDDAGEVVGYNETNLIGMILTCTWCTSLWISPVFIVIEKVSPVINTVFAMSAGAIIINQTVEALDGSSKHKNTNSTG